MIKQKEVSYMNSKIKLTIEQQNRIIKFFMKTSIPRMIKAKKVSTKSDRYG